MTGSTRTPTLTGNRNFRNLWIGQGGSQLGTQVTLVGVPLVAVVTLNGSPFQVAAVTAAEYLPSLVFGLVAGVLVDKLDQRKVMLVTDLVRILALAAIPAAAALGALTFPLLYAVVFLIGLMTLFFDLAYQSGIPRIVDKQHLLDANGRLETTRAASTAVGPPVGAGLVQAFGAPVSLLASAASFLVSWLATWRIRLRPLDDDRDRSRSLTSLRADLIEGLNRVRRDPRQRALIGVAATSNAAAIAAISLLPLWLRDGLHLPVWSLGVVLACGAIGAVGAGFLLSRLDSGTEPWRRVTICLIIAGAAALLVPLAFGPTALRLGMVCLAEAVMQGSITVLAASVMTWRQSITPQHLLAKVISVARTVNFGILPLTSLASGAIASAAGMFPVLVGAAILMAAAPLWFVNSTGQTPEGQP
jgi:MFS family permease